jgi:hypothetical protein
MLGHLYVYRMIYEAATGRPCPEVVHHDCENVWCVNPAHLVATDNSEHRRIHGDGGDKCQSAKTHCPQGHPYTDENTAWVIRADRGGRRERHCRICMREWKRRARARARAREDSPTPTV